jgi:DUF4097 and DUF4098 domain-containing protein YvlB
MDDIDAQFNNKNISLYEFARWAALLEAVDIIAEKCEDRGINFDSAEGMKYIKPLDIQDYVDNRTDTLVMKIKTARDIERNLNNIKSLQIENNLKRLVVSEELV